MCAASQLSRDWPRPPPEPPAACVLPHQHPVQASEGPLCEARRQGGPHSEAGHQGGPHSEAGHPALTRGVGITPPPFLPPPASYEMGTKLPKS